MIVLPAVLAGVTGAVLLWRLIWMRYLRETWAEVCALYLIESGVPNPEEHIMTYSATWPLYLMVGYVWEWEFKRFIVNQDLMQIILDYYAERGIVKAE